MNIVEIIKNNITHESIKNDCIYAKFMYKGLYLWKKLKKGNKLYRWESFHFVDHEYNNSIFKTLKNCFKEDILDIKVIKVPLFYSGEHWQFEKYMSIAYQYDYDNKPKKLKIKYTLKMLEDLRKFHSI